MQVSGSSPLAFPYVVPVHEATCQVFVASFQLSQIRRSCLQFIKLHSHATPSLLGYLSDYARACTVISEAAYKLLCDAREQVGRSGDGAASETRTRETALNSTILAVVDHAPRCDLHTYQPSLDYLSQKLSIRSFS